ncbi:hypothetical protein M513_09308 [Trichuris suis]|uniref:CCHC-type domain-containing protein n=1 Tax=Trichuris suis TaxID=68888 RepID=A0A085LXZ5_9BILA|nr:hypothetical protein M513_09308 [Trichuris suis]
MPRSRSAQLAGSGTPSTVSNPSPPESAEVPNRDLSRVCELLTALTERLDCVVASLAAKPNRFDEEAKETCLRQSEEKAVPSTCASVGVENSWFQVDAPPSSHANVQAPNPWLQKMIPSASIEIFDGSPRDWPRFIACFKSMVHDALSSDVDRLAVLTQLLSPRLREGFAGLLSTPSMYRQVLQELQQLYGDPVATVQSHANALASVEPLRSESVAELERFYLQLNGPVSVLEMNGRASELNSMILVTQVVSKLTRNLREKWAHQIHSRSPKEVSLRKFVDWLKDLVLERRFTATLDNSDNVVVPRASAGRRGGKSYSPSIHKHVRTTAVQPLRHCITCNSDAHSVATCSVFSKLDVAERLAIIRRGRLCIRCLRQGHVKQDCMSRTKCSVRGCKGTHHTLLHGAPRMFPHQAINQSPPAPANQEPLSASVAAARVSGHLRNVQVLCAVVPVIVTSGTTSCQTFALLDSGAEVSIMSGQLSRRLKMHGTEQMFNICTVHGVTQTLGAESQCMISAIDGSVSFSIDPVIVMPKLDLSARPVSRKVLQSTWTHLADLPLHDGSSDDVEMLIGMNVPLAHRHYDLRLPKSKSPGPIGVRTPFGWTVVGQVPAAQQCLEPHTGHISIRRHICTSASQLEELKQNWERFWKMESCGIDNDRKKTLADDSSAMKILRKSIRFTGSRHGHRSKRSGGRRMRVDLRSSGLPLEGSLLGSWTASSSPTVSTGEPSVSSSVGLRAGASCRKETEDSRPSGKRIRTGPGRCNQVGSDVPVPDRRLKPNIRS